MTQTLARERRQKFSEILVQFKVSPYDYEETPVNIAAWLDELTDALVEASISRTERKTDEVQGAYEAIDWANMTPKKAGQLPTLKLYAQATDYFPGSIVWELVHTTITKHELTYEKIHAAAVAWGAAGFKPENVKGILEWAVNGVPARNRVEIQQEVKPEPRPLYQPPEGNFVPPPPGLKPNIKRG